jgi:hypothetical protein
MTDKELYKKCKYYGNEALKWRWKFAGLLPEVDRRGLWKKNFFSVFHFAKVLGGMSEEQTRRVLSLDDRLKEMPLLRALLINGIVSPNKLAKVVSIASPENEEFLANQVQLLSTRALETLVRDAQIMREEEEIKEQNNETIFLQSDPVLHVNKLQFQDNPELTQPSATSAPVHGRELGLSSEVKEKLEQLNQKGIDINDLLLEFLEKREDEIEQEKEEISAETKQVKTRYMRVRTRKLIKKEHGDICSIRSCTRPAKQIHHTQRFALSKNHDPKLHGAPLQTTS